MNVLPSGSYDIVTETGMPALVSSSPSTTSATYLNMIYTFVQNYTTDVNYITTTQYVSVTEKTNTQVTINLPCSLASSTSIVYSLSSLISSNSGGVPSWVVIDSNTGILTVNSPEVDQETNYSFMVNAAVIGVTQQIQTPVQLSVNDWSIWGSEIANVLRIIVQSIVSIIAIYSLITSLFSLNSNSALWSLLSQVQLFFLLLLTRAYIHDDVKLIITGVKITLDIPNYFSFGKASTYSSVFDNFDFDLSNYSYNYVGVNSDSSVFNTSSFFVTIIITFILHVLIVILNKNLTQLQTDWKWVWIIKVSKWILNKTINILTFGYYIRAVLETNQYFLICSVYEIYKFNTTQSLRIISLVNAILILTWWIWLLILAFYLSISSYTINEDKHNKLEEFFNGLKTNKKFKYYLPALILRRTVFVVLLVTWVSVKSRVLIGILVFLDLIYFVYICYLRPFKEFKVNFIEIMNEAYFLLLLSLLIHFNTESYWSSTFTAIYMWLVVSNSIAVFIIILSKYFKITW